MSCNHVNAEEAFDKIQHPFMTKTHKIEKEGNYLHIIKTMYEKPKANIILTGERLKASPLRSGTSKDACLHHFSLASAGGSSLSY